MKFNAQQRIELGKAAMPLMSFLKKNCHPHCQAVVSCVDVELFGGIAMCKSGELLGPPGFPYPEKYLPKG